MTRNITIRQARPSDARELNSYQRQIYQDAKHLITHPTEFRITPFKQRLWIARKSLNAAETCLIATKDNHILGMLESWTDRRRRVRHITGFSMSVADGARNQGIGSKLLGTFSDWVANHATLEKIELHVHADNAQAIALYEKHGFTVEGKRIGAIRYEDGRVIDDILMAKWPLLQPVSNQAPL